MGGIPLIGRTIRAAAGSRWVEEVFVSTDDPEIARVAREFGASVVERPPELAADDSSSEAALLHAVASWPAPPELLVFLQCTSPFTTAEDIDACIAALRSHPAARSAFAAVPDHTFLWRRRDDGSAAGVNHDEARPRQRRQDLDPTFRETGSVYVMHTDALIETGSRFCPPILVVPIASRPLEIDSLDDLNDANLLASVSRPPGETTGEHRAGLRALVMDFDGVLTDDRVFVGEDGREAVACSRSDGMGLEMLRRAGWRLLILSRERNSVVEARARKLGVPALQAVDDKLPALERWLAGEGLTLREAAFVGNDRNDLQCLQAAAWSAVPADAHPSVVPFATYVCREKGGRGAIREVAELLLSGPPALRRGDRSETDLGPAETGARAG